MENFNIKNAIEQLTNIISKSTILSSPLQGIDLTPFTKFSEQMCEIEKRMSEITPKLDIQDIKAVLKAFSENTKLKDGYHISNKTGYDANLNYSPMPIDQDSIGIFYICQN